MIMVSQDSDAHNAVLLSLAALLLAIPAFLVSLWAAIIARTVARRTTEPILTLRILSPAYRGHIDLQNTGAVPATSIRIELIERRRRASALLYVDEILAIGESHTILAQDFPEELNDEFRNNHLEDANTALLNINYAMNNDPTRVAISEDQMAFHVMTRPGDHRIIVSCAIPDKPRQYRMYKVRDIELANPELEMCSTFLVRLRVAYLRLRYKKNSVLKPLPEMPEFLIGDGADGPSLNS